MWNAQVLTMPGPECLSPSRLRFLALCLVLPALFANCGAFKLVSKNARDDVAAVKGSPDDKSEETTPDESEKDPSEGGDQTKEEVDENQRIIAVDQTPFFRWLRSGLRSNAKPSRFLTKGDVVELLKENDEEKFSRIRLADRKKGWVPSRLLKKPVSEPEAPETLDPGDTLPPTEQPESPMPDALPPAGPAQLPTDPDKVQPSLKSDELGEPLFPGVNIIEPKRQPKENPPEPSDAEAKPSGTEVPPPTTPEIPPSN